MLSKIILASVLTLSSSFANEHALTQAQQISRSLTTKLLATGEQTKEVNGFSYTDVIRDDWMVTYHDINGNGVYDKPDTLTYFDPWDVAKIAYTDMTGDGPSPDDIFAWKGEEKHLSYVVGESKELTKWMNWAYFSALEQKYQALNTI